MSVNCKRFKCVWTPGVKKRDKAGKIVKTFAHKAKKLGVIL